MNIFEKLAALAIVTLMSGCADPVAATLSRDEYLSLRGTIDQLSALPRTDLAQMPTEGLVSYRGMVASNLKTETGMVGTLAMDVDFASSSITGTVSDVNFIDHGQPDQTLTGTLALTGSVDGKQMIATADGPLTAVAYGIPATVDTTLSLRGKFRDDQAPADTITGSVTGEISGIVNHSFRFGSFYAQAQP